MTLSARQLNRATLARQLLLRREPLAPTDAVRRVVALQAQEPASPYIALWNRLAPFDPAGLDAAFTAHALVRATLMRITLHAVHAEDYARFHAAMVPTLRASRLNDTRYTTTGLTVADADAMVPPLLDLLTQPRARAEVETLVAERLGRGEPRMWWALRTFAPLMHAPTGGPWLFRPRSAFVAARERLPPESRDEARQWLVRRYLEAFGPASVQDVGQFTLLARPVVRDALAALDGDLVQLQGPDGVLFDVPGAPIPDEDEAAPPRLLPMWDSALLAYFDRSRIIPPEYRRVVIRVNGDVLPTVLVDGYVAGVWRSMETGIEVSAFHPLTDETWTALAAEAADLMAVLADREPLVYRRYAHWWAKLPEADVRLLPG